MGKLTWHKHYHVNFLEGTAELSLQERGAYITILDLIYARDGNVPDDDGFVAKVLGCHWRTWRAIKAKLITLGKIVIEFGKLVNARAKAELKKADERLDEVRPKSSERVQERFKTPHGMTQPQQNQTLPAEEEEEDTERKSPSEISLSVVGESRARETAAGSSGAAHPPANADARNSAVLARAGAPRTAKGTRLDPDWEPTDEDIESFERKGLDKDEQGVEFYKFLDYWKAMPGARGFSLDWDATWRNWIRRTLNDKRQKIERQQQQIARNLARRSKRAYA